jgi:GntR family transcriptional regulator, transcriptional repressor for pyruvate dehydrogenase complex
MAVNKVEKDSFPVKRVSTVDLVVSEIKKAIKNEVWKVGSKLPAESDLAKMYGVNRLTVRLALQKLSTIGIIETQIGEGSFVRNFSFSNYMQAVSDIYLNKQKIDDTWALRRLIEIECALIACENPGKEELAELKHRADVYLDYRDTYIASGEGLDDLVEADMAFHYQICLMSHNNLYRDIYKLTWILIRSHVKNLLTKRDALAKKHLYSEPDGDLHMQLYNAILAHDKESCREVYLQILDTRPDEL